MVARPNFGDTAARLAGNWVIELLAAVLSISSPGTLIVILVAKDGAHIAVWNGITLNALVSILATASRLSALYVLSSAIGQSKWNVFSAKPGSLLDFEAIELASRGPLGFAQSLSRTRRVRVLRGVAYSSSEPDSSDSALVGTLAVILSSVFDPMAQQLLQLRNAIAFAPNDANATMPIARRYTGGDWSLVAISQLSWTIPNFGMQAAVYNGLSQSASTLAQSVSTVCPSGNCTWPSIPSLAVCSRCREVTNLLLKAQFNMSGTMNLDWSNPAAIIATATRFTLPKGLLLDNNDGNSGASSSVGNMAMMAFGTGDTEQTVASHDIDTLIWVEAIIRVMSDPHNSSAVWPYYAPVGATEYALYYCVRTYDLNITNNQVNETSRPLAAARRNLSSWAFLEDYIEQEGDGFNISQSAVFSVSALVQIIFQPNSSSNNPPTIGGWYRAGTDEQFDPAAMQPLYRSRDWSKLFETIASSMSNAIRTYSNGSIAQNGNLGTAVTKYRVSWPWATLPVVVILAAVLELLLTIRQSRAMPVCKPSTLATLSRSPYVREALEGTLTIKDMRDAVQGRTLELFERTAKTVVTNEMSSSRDEHGQQEGYAMEPLAPVRHGPERSIQHDDNSQVSLLDVSDGDVSESQ